MGTALSLRHKQAAVFCSAMTPNPAFNLTCSSVAPSAAKAAIAQSVLAARSTTLLHAG